MAPANGFSVDPTDLTTLGSSFSAAVPGTAADVTSVVGTLAIDTGNAALNARITALAGQVATSLAGTGQALTADAGNLSLNATTYSGADVASIPSSIGMPFTLQSAFQLPGQS